MTCQSAPDGAGRDGWVPRIGHRGGVGGVEAFLQKGEVRPGWVDGHLTRPGSLVTSIADAGDDGRCLLVRRFVVGLSCGSSLLSGLCFGRGCAVRESCSLPNQPQNITVATTGASGSIFLKHFLLALERDQHVQTVNFIASDSALRVMAEELGLRGRSNLVGQILGRKSVRKIQQQANADIGANIASGSYPADAMVVIPCSMGTLARIANGIASQLIERAADVCLKEKRQLVLCVRETPLSKIHIRNMYRAADAGATVFPLIPAFYFRPTGLDAMAREFAYRVLAHIGLPQPDAYRWKG